MYVVIENEAPSMSQRHKQCCILYLIHVALFLAIRSLLCYECCTAKAGNVPGDEASSCSTIVNARRMHAHEGYISLFVCSFVCLSVCYRSIVPLYDVCATN